MEESFLAMTDNLFFNFFFLEISRAEWERYWYKIEWKLRLRLVAKKENRIYHFKLLVI